MAKRKLTAEQRKAIRVEIKQQLTGKKRQADILRGVAAKYGITTITARWYLKSLDGRKGRPPGRRGPGRPPGSGAVTGLVKLVETQWRNAKEARRLVPRWQALVNRESGLRRQAAKIKRQLSATSKKAATLRKRLDALGT